MSSMETFRASTTRPADFDAFWEETVAATRATPMRMSVEPDPLHSLPDVPVSRVYFTGLGGLRIMGWLSQPPAPGKHPAVLILPGYSTAVYPQRAWSQEGFVAFALSPRGEPGSDHEFRPGFPGLMTAGIEDKSTYCYRGIYMDAWRAVDVLLAQPDVDASRLIVAGGSQGGALTLVTAALRSKDVLACAPDVPYLTAIRDAVAMTIAYPYAEISNLLRLYPQRAAEVFRLLDYFDVLNFAPAVSCPTLMSIGLKDATCPPETGYALWNALTCLKELKVYPLAAHEGGGFVQADLKLHWAKKLVGLE